MCLLHSSSRFPFDTKSPIGFSAAMAILYVFTSNAMIIIKSFVLIGIATMPMLFPLTQDMKYDLNNIKSSLKDKTKRLKMFERLSQFIQFHSDTKQLSGWEKRRIIRKSKLHSFILLSFRFPFRFAQNLSKFLKMILMTLCSMCIILISSELLLIEFKMVCWFYAVNFGHPNEVVTNEKCWQNFSSIFFQHQHITNNNDLVELVNLYVQLFCSFVAVFGMCEFGQRVSESFYKINIVLERFKWYLLPMEAQKMLPIIMIVAQEPVTLKIFGSVACNRITFKEVSSILWKPIFKTIVNFVFCAFFLVRFAINRIHRSCYFNNLKIEFNPLAYKHTWSQILWVIGNTVVQH